MAARLLNPALPVVLFARAAAALGLARPALNLIVNRGILPRSGRAFARYRSDPRDVIVACFPKSGTNWAMQLCLQIAHRGAAEFAHIHELVPWPEGPMAEPVTLEDPAPRRGAPTGYRVIKTHLEDRYLPQGPAPRRLTIVRDPKEVVVSSYFFMLGLLGVLHRVTPARWVEMCLQREHMVTRWAEHTAGFWAARDQPNTLVRTFDQLKADLPAAVDDVAGFMGVALTPEERAAVLARCSFAYMREHRSRFSAPPFPLAKPDQFPALIRRGAQGRSDELLSAAQQRQIDALARERLQALGCDFPYDERFAVA